MDLTQMYPLEKLLYPPEYNSCFASESSCIVKNKVSLIAELYSCVNIVGQSGYDWSDKISTFKP